MKILDFTSAHIRQAEKIIQQNYNAERLNVPAMPPLKNLPALTDFAENGLGVAAFEGGIMTGFLCSTSPFPSAFGSTDATGVFSPMGANGVIGENPAGTYARMYQAAGEKWANAGASSHGICLYAHSREAQEQFFRYGFGMRTADAIRAVDKFEPTPCEGYIFKELGQDSFLEVLPLDHLLDAHMAAGPCFMLRPSHSKSSFLAETAAFSSRFFVAEKETQIVAYIRAELDGETFIQNTPGYLHIKGAFCLPEHRGKGVYQNLLALLLQTLKTEGYVRLGVDFESINPAAYGFWTKYFHTYTHGLVRRIDEHAIKNNL